MKTAPGCEVLQREEVRPDGTRRVERLLVQKRPERGLSGMIIRRASVSTWQPGRAGDSLHLRPDAAAAFAEVTRDNVHRRLAIVIDGKLFSAPVIQSPIENGSGQITGRFTLKEATELANALNAPLPCPVTVVEMKNF